MSDPDTDIKKLKADTKQQADEKPANHQTGHRARLRQKFLKAGAGALADYEMLEMLLCTAIPRRDLKPLAKQLIAKFGSYGEVLGAQTESLRSVSGLGEAAIAAIKIVGASVEHMARERVLDKPVVANMPALKDYLRAAMAHNNKEQLRVLFLNQKNVVLGDKVLSEGTIDKTAVYPRELVKLALEYDAKSILIVHNHPSGDPRPSKSDIAMTKEIHAACKNMDINLHDHIIVAKRENFSFKSEGLL